MHCNLCFHTSLQLAGDKSGEAAQDAVEADDEDFDPEGADVGDEAEKVRVLPRLPVPLQSARDGAVPSCTSHYEPPWLCRWILKLRCCFVLELMVSFCFVAGV